MPAPHCVEDEKRIAAADAGNHGKAGETPLAGEVELQALEEWFNENPSDAKSWRVLHALLGESRKRVSASAAMRRFTDDELLDASGLNSFSWKDVARWWEKREALIGVAMRARGLDRFPYPHRSAPLGGGAGNKATSAWVTRAHDTFVTGEEEEDRENAADVVRYELDATPVRLKGPVQRWLFRGGRIAAGSLQHHLIRWRAIGPILVLALFAMAVLFGMIMGDGPLTRLDVAAIVLVGPFVWTWWQTWKPLVRAGQDRICALPTDWLADDEPPAQMELLRTPAGKVLQIVRYVAPCPACGSTLQLDDGAPDFPRRTVGRCLDAPREHVFNFDPVSRTGQRCLR